MCVSSTYYAHMSAAIWRLFARGGSYDAPSPFDCPIANEEKALVTTASGAIEEGLTPVHSHVIRWGCRILVHGQVLLSAKRRSVFPLYRSAAVCVAADATTLCGTRHTWSLTWGLGAEPPI